MGILAISLSALFDGVSLAFVLPLFLALVYLGLYVASGVTFGDPDVSADGDLDADTDTDAHFDAETDIDADGDVDGDSDLDADVGHHGHAHELMTDADDRDHSGQAGTAFSLLSWLGVGRVPMSLWLSGSMLGWGTFGLGALAVLRQHSTTAPSADTSIALAVALVGALLTTRLLSVIVTRIVPIHETYARRRHELLGSVGEAILPIDGSFGMVGVRGEHGELFEVGCRTDASVAAPIRKGSRVKLVAYNRDTKLFHVVNVEDRG